jgi:hypothetical protein
MSCQDINRIKLCGRLFKVSSTFLIHYKIANPLNDDRFHISKGYSQNSTIAVTSGTETTHHNSACST